MHSAFEAIISGRVQGVLFRDFAAQHARMFGVVGEAENMADETLRIHAEGEREKLDAFLLMLKEGPPSAHVDEVTVSWLQPTGIFDRFSIRY